MLSKYLIHPILQIQGKTECAASGEAKQAADSDKDKANPWIVCSSPSTALPTLFPYNSTQGLQQASSIVVIALRKLEKIREPRIQSLIALYFKTNTLPTSKCTALQGQGPVESSEPAQLYAGSYPVNVSGTSQG